MVVDRREIRVDGRLVRVARLSAEQFDTLPDPDATIGALRASQERVDLFTFVQRLSQGSPQFSHPMEWDNLAAMNVTTFEDWWNRQIDRKTRNMVRRAEKAGVTVREVPFDDALIGGIVAIYNESPVRQGKAFWHFGKPADLVCRENATFLDRSVFIGAFLGNELIGFAKIVSDESRGQAGLMQIVAMIQHRDKSPANALIAQAVRSCAERGIPHLFYSKFSFGRRQRDSLSDFKERNGFRRVDLPRYYVSLTATGRVALRLGLHRDKLIDYVPDQLQGPLRVLRQMWTSRWRAPHRIERAAAPEE